MENNNENLGNTSPQENPAQVLMEMKPFEEHIKDMEKDSPLDEKYYEQAEGIKNEWIKLAEGRLRAAEQLEPSENLRVFIGLDSDKNRILEPFDKNNPDHMAKFNANKESEIAGAKRNLEEYKEDSLDELANCCKNQEIIDQISTKLNSNEDFSREELEFLGEAPASDDTLFDLDRYMTPEQFRQIHHGIIGIPDYKHILEDGWGFNEGEYAPCKTVVDAQMREMTKQNKIMLHNSKEVQDSLGSMEERRAANPFFGETNINSATGEARSFTPEDNYPRLENESDSDYANRLKRIELRTRLAEKRGE